MTITYDLVRQRCIQRGIPYPRDATLTRLKTLLRKDAKDHHDSVGRMPDPVLGVLRKACKAKKLPISGDEKCMKKRLQTHMARTGGSSIISKSVVVSMAAASMKELSAKLK